MTFKIMIADRISNEGLEILEAKGYSVTRAWDVAKEDLADTIAEFDALVVRSATKVRGPLLDKADNLKVIGRAGIGLDNIDLAKAQERGITVVNTPQASSISVAELAFGLLLALTKGIVKGTLTLREGKWAKREIKGIELYGKKLGLIGYGNIGKTVEKLALSFGMEVMVVRSKVYDRFISLEELLSKADFILMHVPLTPQTKHMLSTDEFDMMKDGVIIVDCSRGGVVDQEALYKALVSGKVKGAASDVFQQEPPGNHKLFTLESFIATPHIGAQTAEAQSRAGTQIAEEVIKELEKKK